MEQLHVGELLRVISLASSRRFSMLVQADFDELVRSELSKLALPCLLPEHQFLARMIGSLPLLVFGLS